MNKPTGRATWTETRYIAVDPENNEVIHESDRYDYLTGDLFDPGGIHPHYIVKEVVTRHTIEHVSEKTLLNTRS